MSLETFDLDVTDLTPHHSNPRRGNVDLIAESLQANGQYRAIVVNRGSVTGRPFEVLAGNHTLKAAVQLGWETISAHIIDVDDNTATRILAVDNRANDVAEYDNRTLLNLLETLPDLEGTGYSVEDLTDIAHLLESADYDEDRKGEYDEGHEAKAEPRKASVDMIFSTSAASSAIALIGYALGWHPGIITSQVRAAEKYVERFPRGKKILFMDNEWHGYDHAAHVAALAPFHPKYATVRDLVTKAQAAEFDVEYYSVADTINMAQDVAQHCDNVILIPKYDCLAQLPREIGGKPVVLGYSVESSYGGTDIPPSRFKGWPVHLLGGPWKKQRAILNILGDDVVSIDNNNILMTSQFGVVHMPDGSTLNIQDALPFEAERLGGSAMTLSVTMSLAFIMHAIVTEYGVESVATADDELLIISKEEGKHEH